MNKRAALAAAVVVSAAVLLGGCRQGSAPSDTSSSSAASTTTTTVSTVLLVDLPIEQLLPLSQVADIFGRDMTVEGPYEYGTILHFFSVDGSIDAEFLLEEMARDEFDTIMSDMSGLQEVAATGDAAFWNAENGALFVHKGQYAIQLTVHMNKTASDQILLFAQQLAQAALQKMEG